MRTINRGRTTELLKIMELENKNPTAEPVSLPLGFLRFITDAFCNERELGKGAYGVVYKGILPCGSVIAVKKFHERILTGDDRSFEDEASFLMDMEHENIVQLLGYCAESMGVMTKLPNGKGIVVEQLTRMLCFEYMCNGGLDEHLSDESSGLDWNTRYKIIKGICRGLKYLHGRNIIHRDLKPHNILMDTTMVPKIADFGLSRLLGEQKSYTVTSILAGTLGYMAPEYINKGEISKKADIFSLGVIIIQILKGYKDGYPDYHHSTKTDFQHFTEKVLSNWRNRFKGSSECTSPELHTQLVKRCIDIALECVHPDKEKRPDVLNIIEILNVAEESCYDHNCKDLSVDHRMGTQEGLPPSGVGLVALNKIALKDHAQAWIKKGMMKSAVAPLQPQHKPVLESVDGSLAALCYQGARNASFWVAHKALASLEDNVLKNWVATINLGPRVEALERELKSVMVILELALGKVIHNLTLEGMLMELRELVYEAEVVLDEMEYFRIQCDVLDASQHVEGCAHHNLDLNVLPSVHDEPPKLRFDMDNASRRIEHIVEQIQLMQQKVSSAIKLLGSNWCTAPNIAQNRPITISESIEPKLYGRELMMKNIIDDITKDKHSAKVLTVIPIVGPGGIGKTTLAQHVYHSGEVQEHFDVKVWTCVSLNFHVNKLTEEIQRYIPKVYGENTSDTASELIRKRLKNKRLLLVLDDIWDCSDEVEWKRLLVPFQKSQVLGNIIIVTTRFPAQAKLMVRKYNESIYLQGIENKELEELFLQIVFGDDDQSRKDHLSLIKTGFKLVDKLKGSPLAAKTVGRLLKTNLDLDHWIRVLESKEWEHSDGKNDIMPALKLSFEYLPSQLQQCFYYCALFPQDYQFEREELINFWIGQEVLHDSSHGGNKSVEDIGLSYLAELVNYGFLEKKVDNDGPTCYILHDLLHELARKVSSLECLNLDSSQSQVSSLQVLPSIRHLSINIDHTNVKDRLTLKNCFEDFTILGTRINVEKLRTLMIFGRHHGCFVKAFGDLFRGAKALRLVFLSGASYDVKDLLHNFYCLIHLRYLRIECSSWPYEATFPSRISIFYHMKVLHAKRCNINPLPADINNLVKLRNLLVQDDTIHSSIVGVGKLISLQELRRFVVKQEDRGFELKQIGHLKELCGLLSIYNLQKVEVKEEVGEPKLSDKSHLKELILHWDNIDRTTNDSTLEEHVLERLRPGSNLLKLSVKGHRGTTCPSWLGTNLSVKNLESLCLEDVAWKKFPPVGELWLLDLPREENISGNIIKERFRNLRSLKLCKLNMIEKWAVHAPCQLFPFLEVLIIEDCPRLVELSFQHFGCCQQGKEVNANLFPRLSELKITNCPQLSSFPPIPWTKAPCSFIIERSGSSSFDKMVCKKKYSLTPSIQNEYSLTIEGNMDTNDSTFWNVLAFHNLTGLNELTMQWCQSPPLRYLQILSSLKILRTSCSSNTFPFDEAANHVKYQFPVEQLSIMEWNASGKELTQLLTYFPKLSDLKLWACKKVTELGVNVQGQRATETPLFSANKVEQQQDTRAEDDVIVASDEAERDLLLLPPQLQELRIHNWPELSLLRSNPHDESNEGGGGLQVLTSLRLLKISDCPKLLSADLLLLPPQLQELEINFCPELSLLSSNPHDDINEEDGRSGGGRGFRGTSLRRLKISYCPKILSAYSSSSFSSYFPFPNSLEHLYISGEVGTEVLPLSNLTSLTSLELFRWPREPSYSRGAGWLSLLTQGHLTILSLRNMPNFFVDSDPSQVHEQEIPSCSSKLQELQIDNVPGFTAASLRHSLLFSSLTTLLIYGDKKVERFTEEQEALLFVDSLEEITFQLSNLQSLPERLHKLPNLKRLNISYCRKIQIPPKDGFPNSLEELDIISCPKVQSLPKDCLPDSLQILRIEDCEAIQSLPEVDDLPSSLREIDVHESGSWELKSHCRKLINIIPIVTT